MRLAHRLPEPHRQRAVELALDDHVVEDVAAVVDRGVAHDRHLPGVGIDLDLGDMAAVRERLRLLGGDLGVEVLGDLAALLHLLGALGKLEQRDAAVGADHLEAAVLVGDVGFGGFQRGRGDGLALRQHGVDGLDDGAAGGDRRARGDRGKAGDLVGGIAVPVPDLLGRNAEPFGDHAREHRGVALAGGLHVEHEVEAVAAGKLQRRAFQRRAAGVLQHAGDAEPAQLAAPLRLLAALLEAVDVGELRAPCRRSTGNSPES